MYGQSPLFHSTSKEIPEILHLSFESDPKGSLGCQLVNCDKNVDTDMFVPGYAVIGRLLKGNTVAKKYGVKIGDCIVAVNGKGFRRFAADYKYSDAPKINDEVENVELDNRVVAPGPAYDELLAYIKKMKSSNPNPPLLLTLERYEWDARSMSWARFLVARDDNVPNAMMMMQQHEAWKNVTFPIELTSPGMQEIFKQKAVSEIIVENSEDLPPTVYVNYGKLMAMERAGEITSDDVVKAFLIFTERMLSKAKDPRSPKTCQFIDLSGVSVTSGFRVETLKKIYRIFEPNYPETLHKMVMYPVSSMVGLTARSMLSFVNEKTQQKFLITNNLEKVCAELGWDQRDVDDCGGISDFMMKHEKVGDDYIFA